MATILLNDLDDSTDWIFDPDSDFYDENSVNPPRKRIPWIIRVIRKRITGENLKIEITQKAYLLLAVLTKENPGKAMFTLHKAGNFFEKTKAKRWLITSDVVTGSLFPHGFSSDAAFTKWWDEQKRPRIGWFDNKVDDFPNEWRKV